MRLKLLLFGLVALGLVGIMALAAVQEALPRRPAAASPSSTAAPAQRALTKDEESYAQGLWPIHSEVKFAAIRLASGSIQVALKYMPPVDLRPSVEEAATTLNQAEARARQLQPPASMTEIQADYLRAIRLYKESRDELALMFVDGSEGHMRAAVETRLEADKIIRNVGFVLWPNEYPPN